VLPPAELDTLALAFAALPWPESAKAAIWAGLQSGETLPGTPARALEGPVVTDRSTKITYQNVLTLAREEAFYIIRASLPIAEEIAHLQAVGSATFSMALRPDTDLRTVDASVLGETTDRIIEKYGLPIPETYPTSKGPTAPGAFAAPAPLPSPSPEPSASPSP